MAWFVSAWVKIVLQSVVLLPPPAPFGKAAGSSAVQHSILPAFLPAVYSLDRTRTLYSAPRHLHVRCRASILPPKPILFYAPQFRAEKSIVNACAAFQGRSLRSAVNVALVCSTV